jgi:hypothetical protein
MELGRTIPKPEPRKRVKGRKQRLESRVIKAVRALCVTRDGDCRIANWEDNPDDWHEDDLESDALHQTSPGLRPGPHDHRRQRRQPAA